jgi:hypothetical protein
MNPRAGLDDVEKRKCLPSPGLKLDLSVVQPVASLYTDCATPVPNHIISENIVHLVLLGKIARFK